MRQSLEVVAMQAQTAFRLPYSVLLGQCSIQGVHLHHCIIATVATRQFQALAHNLQVGWDSSANCSCHYLQRSSLWITHYRNFNKGKTLTGGCVQIYCSNQNSCHSGLPACYLREWCLHLLAVRGGAHRKKAPFLGVHGVKDTATGTALVISRGTSFPGSFVACSCRVRPDMGRERGGAASFATAHVQIWLPQLQGEGTSEMLAKGRWWKETRRIREGGSLQWVNSRRTRSLFSSKVRKTVVKMTLTGWPP